MLEDGKPLFADRSSDRVDRPLSCLKSLFLRIRTIAQIWGYGRIRPTKNSITRGQISYHFVGRIRTKCSVLSQSNWNEWTEGLLPRKPASGRLYVNGRLRDERWFRRRSCYIMQLDQLQGMLTVEESLRVAADLKLGSHVCRALKQRRVIEHRTWKLGGSGWPVRDSTNNMLCEIRSLSCVDTGRWWPINNVCNVMNCVIYIEQQKYSKLQSCKCAGCLSRVI